MRRMLLVSALMLAASCGVHEWPDADTPLPVNVELVFAEDMPDYREVDYVTGMTKTSLRSEDLSIRYTLKFYPALPGGGFSASEAADYTEVLTVPASETLDRSIQAFIPKGKWQVLCWTDYVKTGSVEDLFYGTSDFSSVTVPEEYVANTDYKDAFCGSAEVDLSGAGRADPPAQMRISMERPLAKFRFIATDLEALVTRVLREKAAAAAEAGRSSWSAGPLPAPSFKPEDYYIRFYYSSFLPCEFNMFKNKPTDSRSGVSFDSEFIPISEKEVRMGFDYVLVNGAESSVSVQVALYDGSRDKMLSLTPSISVPLVRSKVTTVRGDFLTLGVNSGIGVNPSFDDEYTLILP